MAVQETPVVLKCRYRYATGCTAEYGSQPALHGHENTAAAHTGYRIKLTACPVCGEACETEMGRALHLSREHGIRAKSEQRQELDARQVAELYAARYGEAATIAAVAVGEMPTATRNGHAPISGTLVLAAAQDAFGALVAEVETLRAENAELREKLEQVRVLVAG